jgi:2-polyprenyl-3-methyl-5-hydroxy-6-metoxy-1,4-benzoquinol methylase
MTVSAGGEIPSLSHPCTTEKIVHLLEDQDFKGKRILDLGAGAGYLSKRLYDWLERQGLDAGSILTPCDLYPEQFQFDKLTCVKSDFNERLPFADASFDSVVCMEVIEHIPNQLQLMSEMARLVKPGGKLIVTTPNVLNINARLRYLINGTMPLFDILPISDRDVRHVTGHINPISLYYLFYFARVSGFRETRFHIDRVKKSATLLSPAFFLLGKLGNLVHGVHRRKLDYWSENAPAVAAVNRWKTFVGRTIILEATR